MVPKEQPLTMNTTETTDHLREQLRVGVRMLEALEVQLRAAEAVIAREEDARIRITSALDRLEATASNLRQSILDSTSEAAAIPPPPRGASLEASPPKQDTTAIAQMLRKLADDLMMASGPSSRQGIAVKTPIELDVSDTR
jgi:hypothetical protein